MVAFAVASAVLGGWAALRASREEAAVGAALLSVAMEAAGSLDPVAHEQVHRPADADSEAFRKNLHILRAVRSGVL
jgi:hypothetical protein